jgi:hypothetical protein
MAKEKWMKETKEFGTIKWRKVYQLGNKYYSPEKTSHNTDIWWKVFEKGWWKLNRIGTADKNLFFLKINLCLYIIEKYLRYFRI